MIARTLVAAICLLVLATPVGQAGHEMGTPRTAVIIPGFPSLACWDEAAYPVATSSDYDEVGTPANFWVLYQNALGEVFATWNMQTDSLPPDGYHFAVYAKNVGSAATLKSDDQTHTCEYVGMVEPGAFDYAVRGGAMNTNEVDECTAETWWETSTTWELHVSVYDTGAGGGGSVVSTHTFGGSSECTETTEYETDLIIRGSGDTGSIPLPLLDEHRMTIE